MEYWERRSDESWIARWRRLNGRTPRGKKCKHLNGSAVACQSYETLRDHACSMESQKYKVRK